MNKEIHETGLKDNDPYKAPNLNSKALQIQPKNIAAHDQNSFDVSFGHGLLGPSVEGESSIEKQRVFLTQDDQTDLKNKQ